MRCFMNRPVAVGNLPVKVWAAFSDGHFPKENDFRRRSDDVRLSALLVVNVLACHCGLEALYII